MTKLSPPESGRGLASRHDKGSTPLGTAAFVGLRLLDPLLQYGILACGWGNPLIQRLGGTPLPLEGAPLVLALPYWRLTLFGMAVAGSLKGIFYLLYITDASMPLRTALFVGFFKAFSTTVNTLMFCTVATSAAAPYLHSQIPVPLILAASWAIFLLGIFVETYAELQRKSFKADLRNKGKPYTGGLFMLARHINYGGYSVWKTAVGMASAGWLWSVLTLFWLVMEFRRRTIPGLDVYCQERYGAEWTEFKRRTPYKMIPYVF